MLNILMRWLICDYVAVCITELGFPIMDYALNSHNKPNASTGFLEAERLVSGLD
jgi:hypothetical protein